MLNSFQQALIQTESKQRGGTVKRTPDTIYARVDPEVKEWLASYVERNPDLSERKIIEGLIRFFWRSFKSDDERRQVLDGKHFTEFGDLVEKLGWADHAFSTKSWTWAIEEYGEVETLSDKAPGIRRLAEYKQSYCYLDVAMDLRALALQKAGSERRDLFDAAKRSLLTSVVFTERYLGEVQHRVLVYNIACAWSLYAQYTIESLLPQEYVAKLSETLALSLPYGSQPTSRLEEEEWKKIGLEWRNLRGESGDVLGAMIESSITVCVGKAMKRLYELTSSKERSLPKNYQFLVNMAKYDSDTLFLRFDAGSRQSFLAWSQEEGREGSLLRSFHAIQEGLSPSLVEGVAELEDQIEDV